MNPAERVEAVGRWLVRVGGAAAPGDIGAAVVDLNHRTQAVTLNAMRDAGLLEGPRNRVALTAAGWARFSGAEQGSAGEVLDRVLTGWPYEYRAFLELLVSAVIARHHLGSTRDEGHLAFIAIGETGTGKSAMGRLLCHLFGWPAEQHVVDLPAQTGGSLLGRRERNGEVWAWEPAPTTLRPFVMLDEFDKADPPVQKNTWVYVNGQFRQEFEGATYELRATPLLTANPPASGGRYRDLQPAYRRRSVVLDTGAAASRSSLIEDLLSDFYATTSPADRLSLERLRPPADLAPEARAVLKMARDQALTAAGRDEFPGLRSLELATLGRCALMGSDADQSVAAWATSVAYLQATESVPGQVIERWGPDLADVRDALGQDGAAIGAALERGRAERAAGMAEATRGHQRKARADLATVAHAERVAERCRQLIGALDSRKITGANERQQAAGLRKVLRRLATQAANVSTQDGLTSVMDLAMPSFTEAEQLVAAQEAERARQRVAAQEEVRAEQQRRLDAKNNRVRGKELARQQREHHRQKLTAIVSTARDLERLYERRTTRPNERPLDVLTDLEVAGQRLLSYTPPPERPRPQGFRQRVLEAVATRELGVWSVTGSGVAFPGEGYSCPALTKWGPNTQAVLAPALFTLHEMEDRLRAELGVGGRASRPHVPAPASLRVQSAPTPQLLGSGTRYGLNR
ncbi:hypothetical protein GALL_326080 [mine drainage metagenome]|uniref:Uncharacterized protein n=1 Tax=mine drainage metagenome TaxID=410659 RepID=A0A1J5RBN3_9ZZZZ